MKNSQKLILAAITLIIIAFAITTEPIQLITAQATPLPGKPSPKPSANSDKELVLSIQASGTSNYYSQYTKDTFSFHYKCTSVYVATNPEQSLYDERHIKSHDYSLTASGKGTHKRENEPPVNWQIDTRPEFIIRPHTITIFQKPDMEAIKALRNNTSPPLDSILKPDKILSVLALPPLDFQSASGSYATLDFTSNNPSMAHYSAFGLVGRALQKEERKAREGFPATLPWHYTDIVYDEKGFSAAKKYTIRYEDYSDTGEKLGDITIHISFSVRKGPEETEPELEAVIIPGKEYPNWLPKGENSTPLNFKVELREKGKKQPSEKYEANFNFELLDVTKQPGTCLNSPVSDSDTPSFDLEFDPAGCINTETPEPGAQTLNTDLCTSAQVRIKSTDWGAYGRLKVTAVTKKGQNLTAYLEGNPQKTEITIPLDNNNNKIADAWEESEGILGKNLNPEWDRESVPGNDNDGDGLTLFEEYRGIIANGKHTRLCPNKKDLIILNKIGPEAKQGLQLFEKLAKIRIREVKEGELPENRIINKNTSLYREGDQHGLILVNDVVSTISGEVGVSEPENLIKTSPKDCTLLKIDVKQIHSFRDKIDKDEIRNNPDGVKATIESIFACTIAHEIGHACSLQHHGKKSHAGTKISCSDKREVYDVNGNRVQIKRGEEFIIKTPVGDPTGESSGDVYCIMCYRGVYGYVLKRSETGLEQYYEVPTLPGLSISEYTLCKSALGTGYNAPNYPRGPVFGNAANGGNCFSKVRIRDFDHSR